MVPSPVRLKGYQIERNRNGVIRANETAFIAVFAQELRDHDPIVLHPDGLVRTYLDTERLCYPSTLRAFLGIYLIRSFLKHHPARGLRRTV